MLLQPWAIFAAMHFQCHFRLVVIGSHKSIVLVANLSLAWLIQYQLHYQALHRQAYCSLLVSMEDLYLDPQTGFDYGTFTLSFAADVVVSKL